MELLKGIKIIDFTRLLPGPLATHLLSQMGAEVIKIEHPKRPDYARNSGPPVAGQSRLFRALNHRKTILEIDYQSEEGKAKLIQLIESADALIEQFRPGAMESWGLGYAQMKAIHPELVYVSLTGYGQDGPLVQEAGHDINYMALSGLLSLVKDEEERPVVPGFQLADIGGGAYMTVMACLAAILQQKTQGIGSQIDVAMSEGILPFLSVPMALQWGGMNPNQFNILDGKTIANYGLYECADGKWLSVGALEMKFWNNICELVQKPEWKRKSEMEMFNQIFPKSEVVQLFKSQSRDHWVEFFKGQDVCIAPVLELNELADHQQIQARNAILEHQTDHGKSFQSFRLPFKGRTTSKQSS